MSASRLEPNLTKATQALLQHLTSTTKAAGAQLDLFETPDRIRLLVTFNCPPTDRRDPLHVIVPHSVYPEDAGATDAVLITNPPQRTYKDLVASSTSATLKSVVRKVIDIDKLKKKFGTFERKRVLAQSFPVMFVDDRVDPARIPILLGKSVVARNRLPFPVRVTEGIQTLTSDVARGLQSVCVVLRGQRILNVVVGNTTMTPKQVVENVVTVVDELVSNESVCTRGWVDVESVCIEDEESKARLFVYGHDFAEEKKYLASHPQGAEGGEDQQQQTGGKAGKGGKKANQSREAPAAVVEEDAPKAKKVKKTKK
eukprot:PhF_6_TR40983/c0_g1_i1/m.62072/K14775/UTP30, RSL1D1; ribosome biogenesis protein UTP30